MKYLFSIVFLCGIVSWSQAQKAFPGGEVRDLAGKSVELSDYLSEDGPTIISFWATWCAPCKKELDNIAELYPEWQKSYGVKLVAVSVDNARSAARIKPMVDTKGWEYEVLHDPNRTMMQALNFQTVPMTLLIDAGGKIVAEHIGYQPGNEYELEEEIKNLR